MQRYLSRLYWQRFGAVSHGTRHLIQCPVTQLKAVARGLHPLLRLHGRQLLPVLSAVGDGIYSEAAGDNSFSGRGATGNGICSDATDDGFRSSTSATGNSI